MDTPIFLRACSCRRMEANGLGIILFQYAERLRGLGYCRDCIHQYTQAVEHFGFWRSQAHPCSRNVRASEVAEFLSSHLACCRCPPPASKSLISCRAALNQLLLFLGIKSHPPSHGRAGPIAALVARFDNYLNDVCGLSDATRLYRRRYAREFLAWRFKGRRFELGSLRFSDFVRYVHLRAPAIRPCSVSVMNGSLRSLAKYLEFELLCLPGLSESWPRMPNWKRAASPDVLTKEECRNLIRTVDAKRATGKRDLGILRVMLELGLRCSEVSHLRLEDVDWHARTLVIRVDKQRRRRVLPLPPAAANAIADYLRTGRPKSTSRELFLCHRLPVGHPLTMVRVRGTIRRALSRIGRLHGGPHLLRHTFATALHNRGAPLKEVADILGHQSIDTTAIYARVNLRQLEKVALPWPGSTR